MEEPREQKSLQVFSAKSLLGAPAMTSGSPVAYRVTARQEEKMPKKRRARFGDHTGQPFRYGVPARVSIFSASSQTQ